MLEVRSLRGLSHHRTPRLLDATHHLTTVLPDFAKRGKTRAPRGIRAAPKKTRDISRPLEAAFEPGSDHAPTAGWMTVAER